MELLYTLALRAGVPLLPLLARGEGKLARAIRGREGALDRVRAWAREHRDPARPLVWFHAPSVGEGWQARPVLDLLRERRPEVQVAYTFFSPSAERFAAGTGADVAEYLPFDLPEAMEAMLDALRPRAIVFSKTDVWPNLTRVGSARGVRLALLSATLPAGSSRLRGPARRLLRDAYGRLDRVGAISAEDAERLRRLGVEPDRLLVTGDARFDQVLARAVAADPAGEVLSRLSGWPGPILVAGSTWPADERVVLPALGEARAAGGPPWRLLLVPHEPTPEHLAAAERGLAAQGLTFRRWSTLQDGPPDAGVDAVLVDRVGILGELYASGTAALVGGGFGTAGIHSVLEPAAFGLPILFGPRHANAREAAGLIRAGGAFEVGGAAALADRLRRLGGDARAHATAARAARAFVHAGAGAAARGAALVEDLLGA